MIENAAPWLPDGLAGLRREADGEGIRLVGVIVERWLDVDTDGITHRLDVMTSDGAPAMMER